jgi:glucose-1-phosphate adenylyltransferase
LNQAEDSVFFDGCDIGSGARIRRATVDANVRVPADATIGHDIERDRQRYHVSESGIVVVEGGMLGETDCRGLS